MFKKHLALVAGERVEGASKAQFDARQKQAEGHGINDFAHLVLVELSQANSRGIGGHDTQSLPPGRRAFGFDGTEKLLVELGEDIGPQLMARLVERLGGNLTYPVGLVAQ